MNTRNDQVCTLREVMMAHKAYQRSMAELTKSLGHRVTPQAQAYIHAIATAADDVREFGEQDFDNLLHIVKKDFQLQVTEG